MLKISKKIAGAANKEHDDYAISKNLLLNMFNPEIFNSIFNNLNDEQKHRVATFVLNELTKYENLILKPSILENLNSHNNN